MADRVGKQWQAGDDTRTTTRWSDEERAWLEARVAATGKGLGTIVRELVQCAMAVSREAPVAVEIARGAGAPGTAGAPRRVPRAVAPVPRPGAAAPPRDRRVRLDVVVARRLEGGGQGPIPPARLAAARRLIASGGVCVEDGSGMGVAKPAQDWLVDPRWVSLPGAEGR